MVWRVGIGWVSGDGMGVEVFGDRRLGGRGVGGFGVRGAVVVIGLLYDDLCV